MVVIRVIIYSMLCGLKINGKWKYLLALFDTKLNTLVSYKLVSKESPRAIYNFLSKSTRNKEKKSIVTDLKKEYRNGIYKLGFKHQFCLFHTKQKINRDIHNYFKKNKPENEEIKQIKAYKKDIFAILDAYDLESAKNKRDHLIKIQNQLLEPIFRILWKFIIPCFKNLIYWLENDNIERTSNKIENIFQKIFPKSIKKKMKLNSGVLKRFALKLQYWDKRNVCQKTT